MEIVEMKAAEIILDYNLYPRHKIDPTHVAHIRAAIRAGNGVPPVVVCKTTKKATDGFHRITGVLKESGPDATIRTEIRTYKNDRERLLDAFRMNSAHGRNLTPYDRVRCIAMAEEFKVSMTDVSKALRMPLDEARELGVRRAHDPKTQKVVPIKHGLSHLVGHDLTPKQEEGNRSYGGMQPLYYVNQVIGIIENELLDPDNLRLFDGLARLRELLNELPGLDRKSA